MKEILVFVHEKINNVQTLKASFANEIPDEYKTQCMILDAAATDGITRARIYGVGTRTNFTDLLRYDLFLGDWD